MKKKWILCALLALSILMGILPIPVPAAETTSAPTEDYVAPTETVPDPDATVPVSDAPFGSVSQLYGCRTIDGEKPLGGSDRRLEGAQAAFVYEVNTQTVVYSYNPDLELRPGALSKIVTALIAIERCNMDDVDAVYRALFQAVSDGKLTEQRIDDSVQRILTAKIDGGLIA